MQDFESLVAVLQATGFAAAFGLIVWLVKRTFSHTIPRLAADFKESMSAQAEVFQEEMRAEREFFQGEIRAQRQEFRDELASQREDWKKELSRLGDRIDLLTKTIRGDR